MNRTLLGVAAGSAVMLAAAAAQAQTQTMDYGGLEQLFGEPVTTSVTGSPQRASEVPADMVIITQDDIRRSGALDIPGVLRHVTGVDVLQFSKHQNDVSIRGYDEVFMPRLLVLVNGRQVYLDYYGFTAWNAIPVQLNEIRQIEVVKGPNTALFGFNAAQGVINIITYSPLYDDVNAVSLTGGTQNLGQGAVVATGHVGSNFGIRVSGGGFTSDDFSAITATGRSLGFPTHDERGAASADALYQLNANSQIGFEATHSAVNFLGVTPTDSVNFAKLETNSLRGYFASNTPLGLVQGQAYGNFNEEFFFPQAAGLPPSDFRNTLIVSQLSDVFKIGTDHTFRLSGEYRYNSADTTPIESGRIAYNDAALGGMWNWKPISSLEI